MKEVTIELPSEVYELIQEMADRYCRTVEQQLKVIAQHEAENEYARQQSEAA